MLDCDRFLSLLTVPKALTCPMTTYHNDRLPLRTRTPRAQQVCLSRAASSSYAPCKGNSPCLVSIAIHTVSDPDRSSATSQGRTAFPRLARKLRRDQKCLQSNIQAAP